MVEYVYAQCSESEKKEMVFAFYGNYFLLLKETESKNFSLKDFLEKKPNLKDTILTKLEKVATKLVEKGLTRHTLVQAILKDYLETQEMEKVRLLADTIKENLPTLLASKNGLAVACGIFTILDAKDRKLAIKAFKSIATETFTNKIAHVFIAHMINTVDDTVLTKKKLLTEIGKHIDELIQDKCY